MTATVPMSTWDRLELSSRFLEKARHDLTKAIHMRVVPTLAETPSLTDPDTPTILLVTPLNGSQSL